MRPLHHPAAALALVALLGVSCATVPDQPRVDAGRLDLTGWEPVRDGPVRLDGDWAFYWRRLVDPRDAAGLSRPDGYSRVPGPWNGTQIAGTPVGAHGFATYRVQVRLPEATPPLALKLRDLGTAYRLFVDGRLVTGAGVVGENGDSSRPEYRSRVAALRPHEGVLDVVLHVSNFHYAKGGAWELIVLGEEEDVRDLREAGLLFQAFVAGAMVIMALYHLSLFASRRRDRSPLYFAGACFAMVLRVFTTDERTLVDLLPWLPWEWFVRTEFGSMFLIGMSLTGFGRELFREEIPRGVFRGIVVAGALALLGIGVTPAAVYSAWLPSMQAFLGMLSLYGTGLVIRAAWRGREGAGTFAVAFGLLALTVLHDIAVSARWVDTPVFVVPVGIVVFTFLQAIVLSRRLSHTLVRVEEVGEDLRRAHAQLDAHAKTLESRVAERTADLQRANRELDRLASVDGLTGVGNRRFLEESLERSWLDHARRGAALSLLMCDIDHFKSFNDTYGHLAGDEALKAVARTFGGVLKRPLDVVARYGGEEFAVIVADSSADASAEIGERLRASVHALAIVHAGAPSGILTVSVGVASGSPASGGNPAALVSRADAALYRAKRTGRNRVVRAGNEGGGR